MDKLLFSLSFLLLLFLSFFNSELGTLFFANDQALSFAVVRQMLEGNIVLAGPPSHVGGRHLGPYFYWWLAIPYWLADGDVLRTARIASLLQLFSLIPLTLLLGKLFPLISRWRLATGLCLTLSLSYLDTIRIPWHPHLLLPLSSLFLLSTLAVHQKGAKAVGPWLLLGSVLVQTHIASAPLVAAVGLVTFVCLILKFHSASDQLRNLVSFFIRFLPWLTALILSWAPALYYEFYYDQNIARLFGVHGSGTEVPAGLKEAIQSGVLFLLHFAFGQMQLFEGGWAWLVYALILLLSALVVRPQISALLNSTTVTKVPNGGFYLAIAAGFLATAFALAGFKAPLYEYYWSALLPVPALLGGAIFAAHLDSIKTSRSHTIAALLLLTYALGIYWQNQQHYSYQPFLPYHTAAHSKAVAELAKQQSQNEERIEIFPRLHAMVSRNAYYYFLGPEYFNAMEVSWKFKELPLAPAGEPIEASFQTNIAFMVVCPRPYRSTLKTMMAEIRKRWDKQADFIPEDKAFAGCFVRQLARRERKQLGAN